MSQYIVHKAVELSKVKVTRRKVLEQPGYLDQYYWGQHKYDGCSVVFVLGADPQVLTRTGEKVPSLEWLLPTMLRLYGHGVVLAEAWKRGLPFNEISGLFRRHSPWMGPDIRVFDFLSLAEWEAGKTSVPYKQRMSRFIGQEYVESRPPGFCKYGCTVRPAVTYFPEEKTQPFQKICDTLADLGGYDGLILRDPEGGWSRGSGTGGEILKLKRKLSFDLRVTGWEVGKGKHSGRIGALILDFQGKALRVGTGFSDKERERWFVDPRKIVRQIVEVEAMDYSSDGLLREPRFKGVRFDKLETD